MADDLEIDAELLSIRAQAVIDDEIMPRYLDMLAEHEIPDGARQAISEMLVAAVKGGARAVVVEVQALAIEMGGGRDSAPRSSDEAFVAVAMDFVEALAHGRRGRAAEVACAGVDLDAIAPHCAAFLPETYSYVVISLDPSEALSASHAVVILVPDAWPAVAALEVSLEGDGARWRVASVILPPDDAASPLRLPR